MTEIILNFPVTNVNGSSCNSFNRKFTISSLPSPVSRCLIISLLNMAVMARLASYQTELRVSLDISPAETWRQLTISTGWNREIIISQHHHHHLSTIIMPTFLWVEFLSEKFKNPSLGGKREALGVMSRHVWRFQLRIITQTVDDGVTMIAPITISSKKDTLNEFLYAELFYIWEANETGGRIKSL